MKKRKKQTKKPPLRKIPKTKMPPFLKTLSAALAIGILTAVSSPAEALTSEQKDSIIKKLEQLLARRDSGASSGARGAMAKLKAAAGSESAARNLYVECIKRERFERDDKKGGEFSDWKAEHADSLRTDAVGMCLRAHVIGLIAALEIARADAAKPEAKEAAFTAVLPTIFSYVDVANIGAAKFQGLKRDDRLQNAKKIRDQAKEVFEKDIFESEIAKALNITAYIKKPEGFPSKIDGAKGAIEEFVLPRLYEFGNADAIDKTWDHQIESLADRVKLYKAEKLIAKSKDAFEEELPLARWAQARDRFTYGDDKIAGATAMLEVIRTHLDHEFAVSWIEEFKDLVAEDGA